MELAVNMPEHEPHVGQAVCSSLANCASVILPACNSPTPLNTEIKSDLPVAGWRYCARSSCAACCSAMPAAIGPPLTKTVGMLQRMAAHEHAGHDLVAVGDAHHAVETMGLDDGLDAVGDQLARGQGILHAAVAHRDAVVHADGVEDERHAAGRADHPLDQRADLVQVGVARDAVDIAVGDGDERLVPVRLGLDGAGGAQQRTVRRAFKSFFDDVGTHDEMVDWRYADLTPAFYPPSGAMSRTCRAGAGLGCEIKISCPVQSLKERLFWRSATVSETSRRNVASQKIVRADQAHCMANVCGWLSAPPCSG